MFNNISSITDTEIISVSEVVSSSSNIILPKNENSSFSFVNKKENNVLIDITVHLKKKSIFNQIKLTNKKNINYILNVFYFSSNTWEKIPIITKQKNENIDIFKIPLIESDKIQLVFFENQKGFSNDFQLEDIVLSKNMQFSIRSSSNQDRLWVAENLTDNRDEYGWASIERDIIEEDKLEFEFEQAFYLNQFLMKSIKENPNYFPRGFTVLVSLDKATWEPVISESDFFTAPLSWYKWNISAKKIKYVKILIQTPFENKKYQSKVLEIKFLALPENKIKNNLKNNELTELYASEYIPGQVMLAENNSTSPNKVIQGNDARLKDASTEYKGIIQFAKNGEKLERRAVQSNDYRLENATINGYGIVKLAKDNENIAHVVVQGNDYRLQDANINHKGIVQLAKNNESRERLVVQSNDSRLKNATEKSLGIVQLAQNKEVAAHVVVQSNDDRLRNANVAWPGIIQLALHDEVSSGKAVQSDDPRLKDATEQNKGIMQFARERESSELKAVQSNDSRLEHASFENIGLVKLAQHNEKKNDAVVLADDPRLFDKRESLFHEHDYANKEHSLNSHTGSLNLKGSYRSDIVRTGSMLSSISELPFSVENDIGVAAGIKGGLLVYSTNDEAIVSVSKNKPSVLGISKESQGAMFISESDYALYLPKNDDSFKGSEKSLLAEGKVTLKDKLQISGVPYYSIKFSNYTNDVFNEGDLLTVNKQGQLQKIKNKLDLCVGVFVKKTSISLENKKSDKKISVAVAGVIPIKVKGSVTSGSRLGYNDADAGVASVLSSDNVHQAIAVALESSNDKQEKTILAIFKK